MASSGKSTPSLAPSSASRVSALSSMTWRKLGQRVAKRADRLTTPSSRITPYPGLPFAVKLAIRVIIYSLPPRSRRHDRLRLQFGVADFNAGEETALLEPRAR